MKLTAALAILSLGLAGCAGTLNTSKLQGNIQRGSSAPQLTVSSVERCIQLSNTAARTSRVAKITGGISAALATGAASVVAADPFEKQSTTDLVSIGLGIGAGVVGAIATGEFAYSDYSTQAWAHEGCGQ